VTGRVMEGWFASIGYARDTELRGPGMSNLTILAMVSGKIEAIMKQRGEGHDRTCNWMSDERRAW
jgi:hypothetical protein